MELSRGALVEILNGSTPERPVFQIVNTRKIASTASGTPDRFRLIISDGDHTYSHVMLAAQQNKLMESGELENLALVEATKYMCNTVQGDKRVIIFLDLKILKKGSEMEDKIGNPAQLNPTQIPPIGQTKRDNSKPLVENNGKQIEQAPILNKNKISTPTTPGSMIHTISSLTPYQNRWRIRARVTMKSNIRTWSNSRGEGRLFNVTLLDDSGEIRCTGFNDQVDKYYEMLDINKVYYFSKCTLKTANKQYNTCKNDYEMTMNPETIIELCNEDVELPKMSFEFIQIAELEKCKPNSSIDIVGIVKVCNDVSSVIGRASQKEITKRDLQVVDQSGVAVNVTLWGDDAVKFDGQGFPVLAVKGARVSDFGGRSLSVSGSSQMMVNPDIPEAHTLRGWFENEGRDANFSSFQNDGPSGGGHSTNWKTFAQAKSDNLGQGDKADYYSAKGTVVFLKRENCMYQACPTADCNKKLVDLGNGMYKCEKCNREFPNYKWRMILNANIADFSENQWVTCFQDSAEAIIGMSANDLGNLKQNDEVEFDNAMQNALFKSHNFRLRAKVETYNDEKRLKTVCVEANPISWKTYGQQLVDKLTQMGI